MSRTAEHPVSELEHGLAGGGAVAVAVISAVLNNMQATCYEQLAETTGNMLCGTEKTGNVLHAERTETTGNMLLAELKQRATCYPELKQQATMGKVGKNKLDTIRSSS